MYALFILSLITLACVGGAVIGLKIFRYFSAQLGGTQVIRVKVDVPDDRGVKRDVDDMFLNDMIVGEPEGQVGEY